MNEPKKSYLGKKILYALVIAMSGVVLLACLAGILGVWVVQRPLSDASIAVLKVVENSAGMIRQSGSRVDQALAALESKTAETAGAANQLSSNVNDKGLVLVLLPEEKEQQLSETAATAMDTYQGIRVSIASGLELYRSINHLPFVNLPGPSADQMEKLESSMNQIQALVGTIRSGIADFRSGVSGKIDQVTEAANLLANEIDKIRGELAQLDSSLAALEALSIRLQQIAPVIILVVAVILTLILCCGPTARQDQAKDQAL